MLSVRFCDASASFSSLAATNYSGTAALVAILYIPGDPVTKLPTAPAACIAVPAS